MKKALIATTALVAAGFATSATAAEWSTRVTGYYFLGLGVSDNNNQDGVAVLRDGEAHVRAKLVADNGITFQARIELEAFTSGDQIDENYGTISGSFGSILIGSNDDAVYNNHVGTIYAPGARIGYYDAFSLTTAAGGAFSNPGVGSDQIAIHYTSPSLSGFKVYGSYHPTAASDGGSDSNNPFFENGDYWTVGASYNGDFGDFGFGLSAGYTDDAPFQAGPGVTSDLITIGANVSFSGFTVAGTYEHTDPSGGGNNRDEYAIGAQYSTGPWTIGGGFKDEDNVGEVAAGWVTYGLAPGVLFTAGVEYGDSEGVAGSDFGGLAYLTMRF
jgi:predicted porin